MAFDVRPNWEKWKYFHSVKLWQAVALWADINPDRVHYGPGAVHLAGFPGDWIVDMAPAPAAFTDRLDVAISNLLELKVEHMVSGRPAEWDITLASFAARVRSFEGFTVPPELAALAEPDKRDAEILNLKQQVEALTQERDTWKRTAEEAQKQLEAGRDHYSPKLVTLIQAATKFWANADPLDRQTHSENSKVSTWLMRNGYSSSSLADKGATIIRPKWAPIGRKPEGIADTTKR